MSPRCFTIFWKCLCFKMNFSKLFHFSVNGDTLVWWKEAATAGFLWKSSPLKFRIIYFKTPVLKSLFNKVAGLKAGNFIKNRFERKCFPVNIAKFLRTSILSNTSCGCFWMKLSWNSNYTAQKLKFSIQIFFSKWDQIRRKLRTWSHLLKKPLIENFIFVPCYKEIPKNSHSAEFRDVANTPQTSKIDGFSIIVHSTTC